MLILKRYFLIQLYLFIGEGSWGPWDPFFDCNRPCGGGNQTRVRECFDLLSGSATDNCPNFESGAVETIPCNSQACKNSLFIEIKIFIYCLKSTSTNLEKIFFIQLYLFIGEGSWGPWDPFVDCNRPCGGGNQTRVRECFDLLSGSATDNCPNFESAGVETVLCNTEACKKF